MQDMMAPCTKQKYYLHWPCSKEEMLLHLQHTVPIQWDNDTKVLVSSRERCGWGDHSYKCRRPLIPTQWLLHRYCCSQLAVGTMVVHSAAFYGQSVLGYNYACNAGPETAIAGSQKLSGRRGIPCVPGKSVHYNWRRLAGHRNQFWWWMRSCFLLGSFVRLRNLGAQRMPLVWRWRTAACGTKVCSGGKSCRSGRWLCLRYQQRQSLSFSLFGGSCHCDCSEFQATLTCMVHTFIFCNCTPQKNTKQSSVSEQNWLAWQFFNSTGKFHFQEEKTSGRRVP